MALLPAELKREGPYPFEPEGRVFQFSDADKALLRRDVDRLDFGHPFLHQEFLLMRQLFVRSNELERAFVQRQENMEARMKFRALKEK